MAMDKLVILMLQAEIAQLRGDIQISRGFAVGWISNRNALIATLLGVLALIAHDRWRRSETQDRRIRRPVPASGIRRNV